MSVQDATRLADIDNFDHVNFVYSSLSNQGLIAMIDARQVRRLMVGGNFSPETLGSVRALAPHIEFIHFFRAKRL